VAFWFWSVADETHAVDDAGELDEPGLAGHVHRDHRVVLEELGDLRVGEAHAAQHLRADDAADARARAGFALDLRLAWLQAALAADAAEADLELAAVRQAGRGIDQRGIVEHR